MKINLGFCLEIVCIPFLLIHESHEDPDSQKWSVKIKSHSSKSPDAIHDIVGKVEREIGGRSLGQIGELKGHYLFEINNQSNRVISSYLSSHHLIEWHKQEVFLKRVKRRVSRTLHNSFPAFADPLFSKQWHLNNGKHNGRDCNVMKAWAKNITGKGVVVAIVDDGVDWNHPDLLENYCPEGSIDLNNEDDDPSPSLDADEDNKHGTRCAGEVSAVPNSVCGVGIAYGSKFSAIKVLDGPTTDAIEAIAFNKYINVNDVYSCSWGPEDDGESVDGPHELGTLALKHGVVAGRQGFGSIYVVASGNGGQNNDNCNYDGYATSIYTITIGAIDEFGRIPSYAEECASMFACTVSSGRYPARSIVTTDWTLPTGNSDKQCTSDHTGTSAATPLAAGMVALMLEVRPCLTWRDVQHIITLTAVPVDLIHAAWTKNQASLRHSAVHGFGMLDAWRLVNAAKVWQAVPWLTSFSPNSQSDRDVVIPCCRKAPLVLSVEVTEEDCRKNLISTLEHVMFKVKIKHASRGKLKFTLTCPSGTASIVPTRKHDDSDEGLDWTFSTVKCWGESPAGSYALTILDTSHGTDDVDVVGLLKHWQLTIYGSQFSAADRNERMALIKSSYSGQYLNGESVDCPPGHDTNFDVTTALSDRTIKLVTMISCFLVFWAVYYVFEIAVCGPEKAKDGVNTENTESVELTQTVTNNEASNSLENSAYGGTDQGTSEAVVVDSEV